jgi:RimJ/RimL family protein N-acetyltransferase
MSPNPGQDPEFKGRWCKPSLFFVAASDADFCLRMRLIRKPQTHFSGRMREHPPRSLRLRLIRKPQTHFSGRMRISRKFCRRPAMLFPEIARDDVFILGSQRLWLRWPRLSDAADIAAFAGDKAVSDMTASWPHPLPDGEVEKRIAQYRLFNLNGNAMVFVVTPWDQPDRAIGTAGAHFKDAHSKEESDTFTLGYMLHQDFWGQGLMSEAVGIVIDTAFRLTAARAADAGVRPINRASSRILEKHGFAQTGRLTMDVPARGTTEEVDQFRLERSQWQLSRPWSANPKRRSADEPVVPKPRCLA